eukprot:9988412-Ditylum_brightwellii.AAC.1
MGACFRPGVQQSQNGGKEMTVELVWKRTKDELVDKIDQRVDENDASKPRLNPMNVFENEEELHGSDTTPNKPEQDQDEGDEKQNGAQEMDTENHIINAIEEESTSYTNAMSHQVGTTQEEMKKILSSANCVDESRVNACMSACDNYICCFFDEPYDYNMWNKCSRHRTNKNVQDDVQDVLMQLRDYCVPANIATLKSVSLLHTW